MPHLTLSLPTLRQIPLLRYYVTTLVAHQDLLLDGLNYQDQADIHPSRQVASVDVGGLDSPSVLTLRPLSSTLALPPCGLKLKICPWILDEVQNHVILPTDSAEEPKNSTGHTGGSTLTSSRSSRPSD